MILLGVLIAVVGALVGVPALWSLGILVALIGLILAIVGYAGHGWRGRRHYW
jgi:hypothetical protein